MSGANTWIPSFTIAGGASASASTRDAWAKSGAQQPFTSQAASWALPRASTSTAEREAEWAMGQRDSMLARLATEAELSLMSAKLKEGNNRIGNLEGERSAHLATIAALEAALDAAKKEVLDKGTLAAERERELADELQRRLQDVAAARAEAEQLPLLQRQLREQQEEVQRLMASHMALQAQAAATQLRLEEANEQLQQVKVHHAQELLEQQEAHKAQVSALQNKTAALLLHSSKAVGMDGEADALQQEAAQQQVLSLLSQLFSDEISEEEAAQKLATLGCDLLLQATPAAPKDGSQATNGQAAGEEALHRTEDAGQEGRAKAAGAGLVLLTPTAAEGDGAGQGNGAAAAAAEGQGAAEGSDAPATANGAPETPGSAAAASAAWSSFSTRCIMADPEKLVRLINRAAHIKAGADHAGPMALASAKAGTAGSSGAAGAGAGSATYADQAARSSSSGGGSSDAGAFTGGGIPRSFAAPTASRGGGSWGGSSGALGAGGMAPSTAFLAGLPWGNGSTRVATTAALALDSRASSSGGSASSASSEAPAVAVSDAGPVKATAAAAPMPTVAAAPAEPTVNAAPALSFHRSGSKGVTLAPGSAPALRKGSADTLVLTGNGAGASTGGGPARSSDVATSVAAVASGLLQGLSSGLGVGAGAPNPSGKGPFQDQTNVPGSRTGNQPAVRVGKPVGGLTAGLGSKSKDDDVFSSSELSVVRSRVVS